jgi:integrase
MLKEWRLQCQSFKWVFQGKGDKLYSPESWVSKRWSRIRKEHNLPEDLRFHDLRHTFASIMFLEGVAVGDVQKLLRHSSYRTTVDIYRHLLPDQLNNALKTLDRLSIEHSMELG